MTFFAVLNDLQVDEVNKENNGQSPRQTHKTTESGSIVENE